MGRIKGSKNKQLKKREDLKARFERNIEPLATTGCWVWMGGMNPTGYGAFSIKISNVVVEQTAHRASYRIYKNNEQELPDGMFVCHHCDHPWCVNPKHLFLGTPKENTRDSMTKNRRPSNPCPSLNAYKHGCRCEKCLKIGSEYAKNNHDKNKENKNRQQRESYERNKETKLAKQKIYRQQNREIINQRAREAFKLKQLKKSA